MERRSQIVTLIGVLIIAVAAQAAVLYFGTNALLRLGLGLLLLAPILWAGNRLGIVEHATDLLNVVRPQRRYNKLRTQTRALLAEIKRLNWTAVDAERGIRDRDATKQEMDAIEERIKQIVGQLRNSAGEATPSEAGAEQGAPGAGRPA